MLYPPSLSGGSLGCVGLSSAGPPPGHRQSCLASFLYFRSTKCSATLAAFCVWIAACSIVRFQWASIGPHGAAVHYSTLYTLYYLLAALPAFHAIECSFGKGLLPFRSGVSMLLLPPWYGRLPSDLGVLGSLDASRKWVVRSSFLSIPFLTLTVFVIPVLVALSNVCA